MNRFLTQVVGIGGEWVCIIVPCGFEMHPVSSFTEAFICLRVLNTNTPYIVCVQNQNLF
jgi:hypothetical protein